MKLLWIFFLLPISITDNLTDITRALGAGDVDTLQQYFDQSVEIALHDQESVYTKEQAAGILRRFFGQNTPRSFSLQKQGTSRSNDSQYCIGQLSTSNGSYRVNLFMKVSGSKLLIQEMRFDKT